MKNYTSKIATIVYANYTENVDMNNSLFKQSELDALIKNDEDIIRVDYYINGELVGNKMYTPKQAISQIIKMNGTEGNLYEQIERINDKYYMCDNWFVGENKKRAIEKKMSEINDKISFYKKFIRENDFNNSELPQIFCCEWCDFKEN